MPFHDRPFLVRTWTYAAEDVPDEPVGFAAWLDERWTEVDAWVDEHTSGPGWIRPGEGGDLRPARMGPGPDPIERGGGR